MNYEHLYSEDCCCLWCCRRRSRTARHKPNRTALYKMLESIDRETVETELAEIGIKF